MNQSIMLNFGLMFLLTASLSKANELDEMEFDAPFALEDDIPVVLTASRLKQPRAEVPASVSVISAADIAAWGVRTIPELMRFIPGMFIGHGDDENNRSVIYHVSSPNIMRRLQVLVDGRSVYRASIASVVWDDIPVALEDIARIEVTRGPSAATYGANSFLGVINIITQHPADTLGFRVRYRTGNQGYDDSFVSYSGVSNTVSYRISAQINADSGFDGLDHEEEAVNDGKDYVRDSRRHGFVSGNISHQIDANTQLELQASYKKGHTDARPEMQGGKLLEKSFPDKRTEQSHLYGKWTRHFSEKHSSYFQAYWHKNFRHQKSVMCIPTVSLSPELFGLYQKDPKTAFYIGYLASVALQSADKGAPDDEKLQKAKQKALGTFAGILKKYSQGPIYEVASKAFNGKNFDRLKEDTCGDVIRNLDDQRLDIEWQDTVIWTDWLRTVSGISYRRDQAESDTYFQGYVNNDTYRAFFNAEWRPVRYLTFNTGGMYEREDRDTREFSPRIAANILLTPQQGLRVVYSKAIRSPDLLEQSPAYFITLKNLGDNYLDLKEGRLFANQISADRGLKPERINSTELGYYAAFSSLELDVKVYRDRLTQLISTPISLVSTDIKSNTQIDVDGVDLQMRWQVAVDDWVHLAAAYVDADVMKDGEPVAHDSPETVELRASAQDSIVLGWHHKGEDWSVASSHFWYDSYDPYSVQPSRYRRFEVNVKKQWHIHGYNVWLGAFWHHLISAHPLAYKNQRYTKSNLYYLQAGLNF